MSVFFLKIRCKKWGEGGEVREREAGEGTEGNKEGYNSTDCDAASCKMGRKWGVTEEDGVICLKTI